MFFKETYANKRVFLTGHTGFKGSWLLASLYLSGAIVKGYALPPSPEQNLFPSIQGENLCESFFGNILINETLEKEILDFEPDFIFHLAAQPIVRLSYEHPLETFNVNAMGTANVLNACRKLSKPCIVILVTTDKVYQNHEWHYAYRETDRLGGYDPYSASKACAELIIDSFRHSFFNKKENDQHGKRILVARAGNVIGGGDWAKDRIIPDIIRALGKEKPVIVRNPLSVRPWQHVLESVYAYLLMGKIFANESANLSTTFNFGPEVTDCLPVKQVVEYAISIWGSGSYETITSQNGVHEAGLLKLDISRAAAELNWKPTWTAKESISKTINWYKNFDGNNAFELMKKDISSFSDRLTPANA